MSQQYVRCTVTVFSRHYWKKKWSDSCWRAKQYRWKSQRTVAPNNPKTQTASSGFKARAERCQHATMIVPRTLKALSTVGQT
jgi:hypothetical protein